MIRRQTGQCSVCASLDAVPSSPLVAAGLIGGFATARSTGVRALGGVVLALCGLAAGRQWLRTVGPGGAGALGALYLAAFGASHPLAKKLGAWPSVLAVTAVAAGASAVVSDARACRCCTR